jgi:cytoskeleton protein RodZ
MTAGETFRTARQERNLSVEEVSQRTKIRPRIIEAMERDDFAALPAAYMGSFVKTYSQFLGIARLPEIPNLPPPSASQTPSAVTKEQFLAAQRTHGVNSYNGLNGALNGLSSTQHQGSEEEASASSGRRKAAKRHQSYNLATGQQPRWMQNVYIAALVLIMAAGGFLFWKKTFAPEPETDAREAQTQAQQSSTKPLNITDEATSSNALIISGKTSDTAAVPAFAANDSLILEAKAIESAWMNIVMDKKRSEQITLEAGKTYRWSAEKLITLQLGNAGGVQFRRNGVPMEPLGKSGAVVRNVVITREGINSSSSPALAQRLIAAASTPSTPPPASTTAAAPATTIAANPATLTKSASSSSSSSSSPTDTNARPVFKRPARPRSQAKIIEPVTRPILPPEVKPQLEKPKITPQTTVPERRN